MRPERFLDCVIVAPVAHFAAPGGSPLKHAVMSSYAVRSYGRPKLGQLKFSNRTPRYVYVCGGTQLARHGRSDFGVRLSSLSLSGLLSISPFQTFQSTFDVCVWSCSPELDQFLTS